MPDRVRALITGVTGQDGSYLAELLLEKGYEVHGLIRRSSSINTQRIDHIYEDPHEPDRRLILHYGDMSDATRLARLVSEVRPREVYNLAAQSHVKVSFEAPEYTSDVDALGTLRLLEAIHHCDRTIRMYQASTSELFGNALRPIRFANPARPSGTSLLDGWLAEVRCQGGRGQALFSYATPWQAGAGGIYPIYWQKQPGTVDDAVDVTWADGNSNIYKVGGLPCPRSGRHFVPDFGHPHPRPASSSNAAQSELGLSESRQPVNLVSL